MPVSYLELRLAGEIAPAYGYHLAIFFPYFLCLLQQLGVGIIPTRFEIYMGDGYFVREFTRFGRAEVGLHYHIVAAQVLFRQRQHGLCKVSYRSEERRVG